MRAHFCCKMVYCGIFVWCIVGLMRWVSWVKITIGHVSHYQNYCSGVISLKSSHCNSFEDRAPTVSFTVSDFHRDLSAWQGISLVVLAMTTRRWVLYPLSLRESRNCASTYAHFCYKVVHCGIFFWCVVGFVRWDCTIRMPWLCELLGVPFTNTHWLKFQHG